MEQILIILQQVHSIILLLSNKELEIKFILSALQNII